MANEKISELDPVTSLEDTDLVPVVTDLHTTPKSNKITWENLKRFLIGGDTSYGGTVVTNLNTITKTGFYTCYGNATGVPDEDYSWFVLHQSSNVGTVSATQRAIAYLAGNPLIYERVKIASTWGAWYISNSARVTEITSSANPTINTDNYNAVTITAQAEDIASMTTNLSGTPTNFQSLLIRIKDNDTARAITWGESFQSGSATLPTTTVVGKTLLVGLKYDSVDNKWTCEAVGSRA